MTNTQEYMTLSAPELVIGRALIPSIRSIFAELRDADCTVSWADEYRTLTRVRYYNFKVEGPAEAVELFQQLLLGLMNRSNERRAARR